LLMFFLQCSIFIICFLLFFFLFFFFFFSSRRRHTRWPRDWSSDVCSSDLFPSGLTAPVAKPFGNVHAIPAYWYGRSWMNVVSARSEERRVGKECRSRWSPDH